MAQQPIRFDDGAAYERMMGAWSQLVGPVFLDWLSPATGQRWIDVGCGNGTFTEQLIQRCAPAEAQGIDPSEAQLAFARTRPGAAGAVFLQGDAMALPFEDDRFDVAVMALVIHFVPDPAKGIGELTRVVRPGGLGRGLCVGRARRQRSHRADPDGNARPGRHTSASAQRPRLPHGGAARLVDGCGTGGDRDPRDHGATQLRQFRQFLASDHSYGGSAADARTDGSGCYRRIKGAGSRASPGRRPGADHI